jgi:hypothetical protein
MGGLMTVRSTWKPFTIGTVRAMEENGSPRGDRSPGPFATPRALGGHTGGGPPSKSGPAAFSTSRVSVTSAGRTGEPWAQAAQTSHAISKEKEKHIEYLDTAALSLSMTYIPHVDPALFLIHRRLARRKVPSLANIDRDSLEGRIRTPCLRRFVRFLIFWFLGVENRAGCRLKSVALRRKR